MNRRYCTLILLAVLQLSGLSLQAQTPEIEQLLKTVDHATGKEKVDACSELSFKYYMFDPRKGIYYGEKALRMADSLKLPQTKAKAYNNLGANYLALSKPDAARGAFRKALTIATQYHDSTETASSYNRLGVVYEKMGVFDSALIVFDQALTLYHGLRDFKKVGKLNENIGMIHLHRGELKTSLTFLLRAKTNYEKAGSKNETSSVLLKIGRVYFESHDYASAEKWYNRSKEMAVEINDIQSVAMAANVLGILYKTQDLHAKALAQFDEVLKLNKQSNNKKLLLAVHNNMGNVYSKIGENEKAVYYHKQALAIAEALDEPLQTAVQQVSLGNSYNATRAYGAASQLFQKALPVFVRSNAYTYLLATYKALIVANNGLSNHQQSVAYYEKYVALKDSLTRTEQNVALDSLKVKFNTEQALSDNLLLEQKNQIQSKTISLQRTIMISAIIFAILLMGFIVFVIINRLKIKKINRLLAIKNDEISAKADELNAKNKQLTEYGHYKDSMNSFLVHDLKNPLNTIVNANIEQLTPQEAEALKQSGLRMLNIVTNILDISKYENQMLQLSWNHAYISKVFQEAAQEVLFLARQKSISMDLQFHSDYMIRADLELVKRVFVNMLTNAIKFSKTGGQICICAETVADSQLKISIGDEGEGISPAYLPFVFDRFTQEIPRNVGISASTGIGLSFCKMAVEMHDGKIGVESTPKVGTTFWFTLPLSTPNPMHVPLMNGVEANGDAVACLELTADEKVYLAPFCKVLESTSVYQLTDVKDVVRPIEEKTTGISAWKNLVLSSLSACNEHDFKKLINLCHGHPL